MENELIQKLIDDITSDNTSEAGASFEQIINAKLNDALESKKQEVAQTVYDPTAVEDTGDEEIETENDTAQ